MSKSTNSPKRNKILKRKKNILNVAKCMSKMSSECSKMSKSTNYSKRTKMSKSTKSSKCTKMSKSTKSSKCNKIYVYKSF